MVDAVFHDEGFNASEALLLVIVATRHGLPRTRDLDGDARGVPLDQGFGAFDRPTGALDQVPRLCAGLLRDGDETLVVSLFPVVHIPPMALGEGTDPLARGGALRKA